MKSNGIPRSDKHSRGLEGREKQNTDGIPRGDEFMNGVGET